MAEPRVLIVDLDSDVRNEVAKIETGLKQLGLNVLRPESGKALTSSIGISNVFNGIRPDLVVHFSLGDPTSWDGILDSCEMAGVRVSNPYSVARRFTSRVGMCSFLDTLGISQPDWYYGSPAAIPEDFGDLVVEKSVDGHLVHIVDRRRIHAAAKVGFYQRFVDNPAENITTVYWIFGHCFSMIKPDMFNVTNTVISKKLVDFTDPVQVATIERIQKAAGLDFFCADFINGYVIDVNFCPNPFRHPRAVEWLTAGFARLVEEQSTGFTKRNPGSQKITAGVSA